MDLKLEWTQALCVWQQWPVTATTDIQALRDQTFKKGSQRGTEGREITVLTPVVLNLLLLTHGLGIWNGPFSLLFKTCSAQPLEEIIYDFYM